MHPMSIDFYYLVTSLYDEADRLRFRRLGENKPNPLSDYEHIERIEKIVDEIKQAVDSMWGGKQFSYLIKDIENRLEIE